ADRGVAINSAKVSEVVGPALAAGELVISRADGALTITAGRAHVSNVIAHGEGADLTLGGTLDLASRALDARLTLSGPADGGAPGPGPASSRATRPKESAPAPARPLARDGTALPAPQKRSILDRLFGTHN